MERNDTFASPLFILRGGRGVYHGDKVAAATHNTGWRLEWSKMQRHDDEIRSGLGIG
jgi:hypothetical protein